MATTTPERVDEEINKYVALLSDLRSHKNSFLPIFRLPPETLASIFTYAARDHYEGYYRSASRTPPWINVSYVCRHWRNVALNCSTLWTYLFNVSPSWMEELLARSKQASLRIRVNSEYAGAKALLSSLIEGALSRVDRIQELCLNVPSSFLPTELSLNAPRLQILDIHIQSSPFVGRTFKINNGENIPLRTLKLAECPLPWHSSLNLSGVTTLSLSWIPSQSQQNIPEFLTTLGRMQALRVLHLERALPSARDFLASAASSVSQNVALPRLVQLFVRAPLSTVVALLSRTVIPLKTQVKLEIESGDNSSVADYAQLLPVLAQRFSQSEDPSSSSPTIRSLIICFSYGSNVTIGASEHADCDPNLFTSYPPRDPDIPLMIQVTTEHSIGVNNKARIVGDICCSIPSAHVQTLHVISPPFSPEFWRTTLGHLDELRYMKLCHGDMPDLGSLLALPDDDPEAPAASDHGQTPGHTFVPNLEKLELYSIVFAADDESSYEIVTEDSLRDALSSREEIQLIATECDVRQEEDEDEEEEYEDEYDEDYDDEWGVGCQCPMCATWRGY